MPQKKLKVFHVEDYRIMRDGVRQLLSMDSEIEMVGDARNGEDLFLALDSIEVDVLILDIYLDAMEDLKTMNGFQICRSLSKKYPNIKTIAHSVYDDPDRVAEILKAGAMGFVSKKAGYEELIRGVKAVARGEKFICSDTSGKLKNLEAFLLGLDRQLKGKVETFSVREREVLRLLSEGKSSREIASSLFITERTVESHRKNMMGKAKAKNTVELVANAALLGYVH